MYGLVPDSQNTWHVGPKRLAVGPYKAILIGTVPCTFQLMYIKSSEDLLSMLKVARMVRNLTRL